MIYEKMVCHTIHRFFFFVVGVHNTHWLMFRKWKIYCQKRVWYTHLWVSERSILSKYQIVFFLPLPYYSKYFHFRLSKSELNSYMWRQSWRHYFVHSLMFPFFDIFTLPHRNFQYENSVHVSQYIVGTARWNIRSKMKFWGEN